MTSFIGGRNNMAKFRASRPLQMIVLLLICTASGFVGFAYRTNKENGTTPSPTSIQQSDEKVVERKEYGYEPFEFKDFSVRKVKIAPSQKLSARALAESAKGNEGDWLADLEFNITNKWNQAITYIDLELEFPETATGGLKRVYDMDIGIHPAATSEMIKYGKPLKLNSNETYTFRLSVKDLEKIKKFLSRGSFELAHLNKLVIDSSYLYFEDGMKWEQGSWYKPVPSEGPSAGKPGRYEKLNSHPKK
jgi:hypothetical protein